jgi:hypothetical protein
MSRTAWKHTGIVDVSRTSYLPVSLFIRVLLAYISVWLAQNLCVFPDGMCVLSEYTTVNDRNQEGFPSLNNDIVLQ